MKDNFKVIIWLIVFIMIVASFIVFAETLALFESNGTGDMHMDIGRWIIKISDINITNGNTQEIVIDNFNYSANQNVAANKIAPGSDAYFDLIVDASGCDVAVKYDITFNFDQVSYADNIGFSVSEIGGDSVVKTAANTYSGIIDLDTIEAGEVVTLRVSMIWNNIEDYNDNDTVLGLEKNSKLALPITINAIQYLGEELVPYEPTNSTVYEEVFTFVSRASANTVTVGDVINITNYGNFYVLSTNSTTTKLLPYYNINVGPNKISSLRDYGQDSNLKDGRGQLIYSNSDYWTSGIGTSYIGNNEGGPYPYVFDSNSNLNQYATGYRNVLTSLGFTGVNVKLLSFEEANSLFSSNNSLVCGSTFWLGSSRYGSIFILEAASTCEIKAVNYSAASGRGFRPIVSIDTNNLL